MASSPAPNTTLYINNLNDKINKDEMRLQLYALFTTHGKIIDIVISKTPRLRGQAFLVFTDLASATLAMRSCQGMVFYDKPLRIAYAKTRSYATSRREDPDFVPPNSVHASDIIKNKELKRTRDEDAAHVEARAAKREKAAEHDDEEMEIDDDEDASASRAPQQHPTITSVAVPQSVQQPSSRLLCTNLPQEVTDDVLAVLFQQYRGFQTTQVVQSPTPNADGAGVKMAQVIFESAQLATVAKEALDGFTLKKGWLMSVAYV
ncbi:RNA-binding domain-containing protein [Fistulina hepatica ATCC 64428]|uniref:RNA-binding domain-containing protein n=1 Tax=Fistulina hepatica ATCC 64428 TaxID=1128425 RepID=A0A0D7ALG0_9AGAR|nr:RNA-binding domain-containing protein [Fistulina hepatica ATCC 64428]